MIKQKTDEEIVKDSPVMAVTYCMYDYGEEMEGLYLNCERQFFDSEKGRWVDMILIEDYFHTHRRIDDIRALNSVKSIRGEVW